MRVAAGEPQPALSRRTTDHRPRIGKTRPAAHPGRSLERLAQREKALRCRQQAVELYRRQRCVAGGELDPGGKPDALVHRREAIADFYIDHRTRERGVTSAAIVAVVAALAAERQRDAER